MLPGVAGAMIPPPSLDLRPMRGTNEAIGASTALTSDPPDRRNEEPPPLRPPLNDVRLTVLPMGDGGAEDPAVREGVETDSSCNLPKEGMTLSFALKLRNRNNGMNHTHTAKNAATSMKLGGSLTTVCEYL